MKQPLIAVENVVKRFGHTTVLHQLSFTLQAGEPVALIGPNGAGKTTLFSLLCGYLTPDAGQIRVLGQTPGASALIGQLSALPQDAQFDPAFSIQQQLQWYAQLQGMAGDAAKAEAQRVLQLVDLLDHAASYPAMLSHGMRKRASIAQALIGRPKLVLLDEPTAGLDPMHARQIRQLIAKLSDQATFLISSHNIFELERLCRTMLYLEQGVITWQQTGAVDAEQDLHAKPAAQPFSYLQLLVASNVPATLQTHLRQLAGVVQVEVSQKDEYLLQYDAQQAPDLDISLLQLLRQQGWHYRSLVRGQSLEQQLFQRRELA